MRFVNAQIMDQFLGAVMIFVLRKKVTKIIAMRILEIHTLIQSIKMIKLHGRNSAEPLEGTISR
jgi:hypothetical protein